MANVEAIHFGKANMMAEKRGLLTIDAAEKLAIEALGWLAAEPEAGYWEERGWQQDAWIGGKHG